MWYHSIGDVELHRTRGHMFRSIMYMKSHRGPKYIYLTSKKGNTNGSQQVNGRNHRITGRKSSFKARSPDRKGTTQHEEQLSLNRPITIRSSLLVTGTYTSTLPLPARKSGTRVYPTSCFVDELSMSLHGFE
mmetsp:Transcript_10627/g.65527  ORF Transcript_10627/g.65527 Transcript_10627/m.65527 type:complete len:132 (-) Transcript_10627:114-509(-)